jgi:hypothetical protein
MELEEVHVAQTSIIAAHYGCTHDPIPLLDRYRSQPPCAAQGDGPQHLSINLAAIYEIPAELMELSEAGIMTGKMRFR